jgi:hypothetical protein
LILVYKPYAIPQIVFQIFVVVFSVFCCAAVFVSMSARKSVGSSSSSNTVEATSAINGPLIFSCKKCHRILGDSLSLVGTHEELKTITLSAASNIIRTEDLITVKQLASVDKGSAYVLLNCSTCQKTIGKYYLTTPKALDELRENFTFSVAEIDSYELGKAEYGDPSLNREGNQLERNESTSNNSNDEIFQIKHVLIGLEERLRKLETALPSIGAASSSSNGHYYNGHANKTLPPPPSVHIPSSSTSQHSYPTLTQRSPVPIPSSSSLENLPTPRINPVSASSSYSRHTHASSSDTTASASDNYYWSSENIPSNDNSSSSSSGRRRFSSDYDTNAASQKKPRK